MKMKFFSTLCILMMALNPIASLHAQTEPEPFRTRIESTELPEDLERMIEEQYYEEQDWTPKDDEELIKESADYYPHDYSRKTVDTIGYQGASIVLDDGSIWVPKPNEAYRAARWADWSTFQNTGLSPSQVFIATNESWFYSRNYKYLMVNKETGESVPVMLIHGPRLDRNIQIANIYHDVGKIELTDQHGNYVVMILDGWDKNICSYWQPGQRIFIGRNCRWSYYNSQYILINLDYNMTHVRAAL